MSPFLLMLRYGNMSANITSEYFHLVLTADSYSVCLRQWLQPFISGAPSHHIISIGWLAVRRMRAGRVQGGDATVCQSGPQTEWAAVPSQSKLEIKTAAGVIMFVGERYNRGRSCHRDRDTPTTHMRKIVRLSEGSVNCSLSVAVSLHSCTSIPSPSTFRGRPHRLGRSCFDSVFQTQLAALPQIHSQNKVQSLKPSPF